jgi:hypothetical protein
MPGGMVGGDVQGALGGESVKNDMR